MNQNALKPLKKPKKQILAFLAIFAVIVFIVVMVSGCASVQHPTGGPKDSIPPKIVRELPENLSRNFTSREINIEFDEFVKLSNEFTEISISPALENLPTFKLRKQTLQIKFLDSLEKNTTYTINFGNAIADINESNILKNYSYVFSTGNTLDSLSISGKVISALTKENLKDVTVILLPVRLDSLLRKKRASIFTTTDTAGNFRLQNLRRDEYNLYALKEQNGDRIYNLPGEEIAFLTNTLKLNKDTSGLLLQVFKETPVMASVNDRRIENDGRLTLTFNRPLSSPSLSIIDPVAEDARKTVEFSANRDSATLWLPELTFDSISVAVKENGISKDTVQLRRNKKDSYTKILGISDNIPSGRLKPKADLLVTFSTGIASFDAAKITLLEDSVPVKDLQITKDLEHLRSYLFKYPWRVKKEYILKIAENAFTDHYGNKNKTFTRKFTREPEDNFGNISLMITLPDTTGSYVVEWLSDRGTVLRSDAIKKSSQLTYTTYPTGKYRVRVIYDQNKNGAWDTGSLKEKQQPEMIWNYEKAITLRANWDLEEKIIVPRSP